MRERKITQKDARKLAKKHGIQWPFHGEVTLLNGTRIRTEDNITGTRQRYYLNKRSPECQK